MDSYWIKSSYSTAQNVNCVECRTGPDRVLIRDTQHRGHGHLSVPPAEWRAFVAAVRAEEL